MISVWDLSTLDRVLFIGVVALIALVAVGVAVLS
jgi:hypothetical protein